MEEKNRQLLAKTAIHINCFSLALCNRIAFRPTKQDATMLIKNMELSDSLDEYIRPYMNEDELKMYKIILSTLNMELNLLEKDIERVLIGEENER